MLLNQCRKPARVSTKCRALQVLALLSQISMGPWRVISGLQKRSWLTLATVSACLVASCSLVIRISMSSRAVAGAEGPGFEVWQGTSNTTDRGKERALTAY